MKGGGLPAFRSCLRYAMCQNMSLQGDFAAPVRTNKYPREIPELPWYRTAVPQMLMAGACNLAQQTSAVEHAAPDSNQSGFVPPCLVHCQRFSSNWQGLARASTAWRVSALQASMSR